MIYLFVAVFCAFFVAFVAINLAGAKRTIYVMLYSVWLGPSISAYTLHLTAFSQYLDDQRAKVAIGMEFRKALHTPYRVDPNEILDAEETIDASKIPVMKGLPMLGIVFKNPSPQIHYLSLGTVASIAQTQMNLAKMHGYEYRNKKAYVKSRRCTAGQSWTTWSEENNAFSYTYQRALDPSDAFYVACHEEMHVAQHHCKKEINHLFEYKMRRMGRFICLNACSNEVRCDLAGIVRLLEIGYPEDKLPLFYDKYKNINKALKIFDKCKQGAVQKAYMKKLLHAPETDIYVYMFPLFPEVLDFAI